LGAGTPAFAAAATFCGDELAQLCVVFDFDRWTDVRLIQPANKLPDHLRVDHQPMAFACSENRLFVNGLRMCRGRLDA